MNNDNSDNNVCLLMLDLGTEDSRVADVYSTKEKVISAKREYEEKIVSRWLSHYFFRI